jgi:hypothetical protein
VHIAIATGSTSAHNNINNNSFNLIRSPFADQFWLLTDMAPDTANTVVDFTQGTDVLEISGQGAGVNFASLTRTGNSIALNGDVFATLNGFDTTTLTAADFVFE